MFTKQQRKKLVAVSFSRQAIYNWEQGIARPQFDAAEKICKTLKISMNRLAEILPSREDKAS